VGYKKDTKNESDMKSRQSKQDRQANLMIAVAVIAGVYFVVWTLIGLIS
jgi:methionine-rich copper-binding protein CopC